jgi:outer membrane protein OmpA-like peptidoglycan-associated protein
MLKKIQYRMAVKKTLLILFCFCSMQLLAQNSVKKQSTVDFHMFYNDFNTAQQIRATSLSNVINNKLWSPLSNNQVGLGLSYYKGITKKIDAVGTVDGSFVDYLFQSGATNGSSKFLLTAQAAANIKLFDDTKTVVPYLTGGAGFSLYNGKTGFYIPAGVGLQFNVFNEGFIFANAQYRVPLTTAVNYHFNYSIGIGTAITKAKAPKVKVIPEAPKEEAPKEVVKIITKNIIVTVTDEATGLPLPNVAVALLSDDGNTVNGVTDAAGKFTFDKVDANNYSVSGKLNNINSTTENIKKNAFKEKADAIKIGITHNDPRFTLTGKVVNKSTNVPEGNVEVTATNITKNTSTNQQSNTGDGTFTIQLEGGSEFTIVGKKASYLSNIEKVNTNGLNRSTTLYLKLELDVQEVTASKNIVLNNINFESGKSLLNVLSSNDLDRLVLFLQDNPSTKLEIQGHTDNSGSVSGNNKLSQTRANSIVTFLISKGIDKSRLIAKGFGSSVAIASNNTPEGKAQNRRVEMKLIE